MVANKNDEVVLQHLSHTGVLAHPVQAAEDEAQKPGAEHAELVDDDHVRSPQNLGAHDIQVTQRTAPVPTAPNRQAKRTVARIRVLAEAHGRRSRAGCQENRAALLR
jgi:hypothetical protein